MSCTNHLEVALLRDALDHIRRVALASRTQSRRHLWIASRAQAALEGRPYVAAEHSLPPSGESEIIRKSKQNTELRAHNAELRRFGFEQHDAIVALLDAFVDNPASGADTRASAVDQARRVADRVHGTVDAEEAAHD